MRKTMNVSRKGLERFLTKNGWGVPTNIEDFVGKNVPYEIYKGDLLLYDKVGRQLPIPAGYNNEALTVELLLEKYFLAD
jgi:hypothetical protein